MIYELFKEYSHEKVCCFIVIIIDGGAVVIM